MPSPDYYSGTKDATVQTYEAGLPSTINGTDVQSLQSELQRLTRHTATTVPLLPQVANQEPQNPVNGMIRYAKAPWNPLGLGDGWVQYLNGAWIQWPNAVLGSIQFNSGTVSAPSITFAGDTDTGIYRPDANQMGLVTNGALRLWITTTAIQANLAIRVPNGTAASPAYQFTGDTNTGLYWISADVLGISTGGAVRMRVSTTGVTISGSATVTGGLTAPSISSASGALSYSSASGFHTFNSQALLAGAYLFNETGDDTGMYSGGDGVIAFKTNGVYRGKWNAAGVFNGGGGAQWQTDGNMYMPLFGDWLSNVVYYSDERLKENIRPVSVTDEGGLESLDFIEFDWKTDDPTKPKGHVSIGLSAQQVQAIDPTLVRADSNGTLYIHPQSFSMRLAFALKQTRKALRDTKAELGVTKTALTRLTSLMVTKGLITKQERAALVA